MARTTYSGYSITSLRQWARDLKIAGRSKMGGDELLTACKAQTRANIVAAERAVTDKVDVTPGVLLRHKTTGTVVRVTSELREYVQDGVSYESLCFTAEYVEMGEGDLEGNWRGRSADRARHLNNADARTRAWNEARGYGDLGLRHMLYQYEAITTTEEN